MLLGEFEHTVDDKNRLTLPAKFRQALSGGLVITRGMDGCLYCYPQADWERLVESRLAGLDPLSREGRLMHRFFFAGLGKMYEPPAAAVRALLTDSLATSLLAAIAAARHSLADLQFHRSDGSGRFV